MESQDAAVAEAHSERDSADLLAESAIEEHRLARRAADEAAESLRRAAWQVRTRAESPQSGPIAVERAEVAAELAAEERIAARMASERDGARAKLAALAERRVEIRDGLIALAEGVA